MGNEMDGGRLFSHRGLPRWHILWIASVGAAYFLAHQIAFLFPDSQKVLMAVWPAAGIGLAALLLSPRRLWPAIVAILFVAGNLADWTARRAPLASVGFMTANVLESVGCAWVIVRTCGERVTFGRVREVLALLGVAAFVNAGTACIGAATAHFVSAAAYGEFWKTWWTSDGLGIFLVTPFIVAWARWPKPAWNLRWPRVAEAGVLFVLWCTVAWLALEPTPSIDGDIVQPYFMVALLAWPALRFGPRGITLALVLLATITVTSTEVRVGYQLWGGMDPMHRLLFAQLYVGVAAISGLLLAASYSEAKSAEKVAVEDTAQVRALGDNLPDGMVYQVVRELDGSMRFLYVSAGVERLSGLTAEQVLEDPSTLYGQVVPEDRATFAAAEAASARDMSAFSTVARFRRADGQIRRMRLSSAPRRLENGRILWDGIMVDITERKKAEEEIELLKHSIDVHYDGAYWADSDGRIFYVNDSACKALGYERGELIGKTLGDISPKADSEHRVWETLRRNGSYQSESVHRRKDGSEFPVEISTSYIRFEGREFACGFARDITERRRAEEEMRAKTALLEAQMNATIEGILVVDPSGRTILQNQRCADLLKIPENIVAKHDSKQQIEFVKNRTKDPEAFVEKIASLYAHPDETGRDEVEFLDGTVLDRYSAPIVGKDGALFGRIWTFRDITQQKLAEATLRESEENLQEAQDIARMGRWELDLVANHLTWSDRLFELFELDREAFGGTYEAFLDVVHPDDRAVVDQTFRAAVEGRKPYEIEHRLLTRDGGIKWVNEIGRTQYDPAGRPVRAIGTGQDITERRRAEEALRLSEANLRKAQEYAHVGSWTWDIQTDRVEWSDEMFTLFGLTKEDFPGVVAEVVAKAIHPDDRQKVTESNRLVIEAKQMCPLDYRVIWPDGSEHVIWAEAGELLLDEAGNPVCLKGFAQDITERKRAEETLRESEEKYRSLFAAENDSIFLIDLATNAIVDVNDAACRLYGYTRAEMMRLRNFDVSAEVGETLRTTRENTPHIPIRYHKKKSGEVFPVEISTSVLSLKGRSLMLGAVRDITERKRAEEEIQRNESRLRSLVNILQHPSETTQDFLDYALEQAIQLTESKIGYIFRYSEERKELTLNTWSKGVMAQCSVPTPSFCYELEKTGIWGEAVRQRRAIVINDFVADHPLKKGYPQGHVNVLKFMTVPIFKDQVIVGVVGLANKEADYSETDVLQASLLMDAVWKVIDRKRAEEALRESESFLSTFLNAIPVPVFYKDREGRYQGFNRAFETFYCETKERLIGKSVFDLGPPELAEKYRAKDEELLESGGTQQYESQVRNAQGELRDVVFHKAVLTGSQGAVSGLVGAIMDVTERKQAEVEKGKLQEQLAQAQKMESVGRLAGGVAHDFNNMLAVILGHAEMAMDQVDPVLPLHADLTEISKAARRSADLTEQLLAFARKQTVMPRVLDLNDTVRGMLKMLQRLIGEDITIAWRPAANLWSVRMDQSQIDQILANLCVNARDAIGGVGRITIETGNTTFDSEYCATHTGFVPGEYVRLSVSDDGRGMDQETLGHIFEPFFTTKGVGEGTGLGLSTVYGAVKQNNGFVNVYSELGHGSCFTIYLPRHVGESPEEAPAEVAAAPAARGHETILLVEDEPAILRLTATILARQGYTVLEAATPGEAVRLAREHDGAIHLLITDVVMPEMNGRDLAKNLLALYPGLKRLFMSGYTANVIASHGVLDEGVQFIQKPFTVKGLAAKVREALGGEAEVGA